MAPQEGGGEIDRVLQQQDDALLPPDTGLAQGTGEATGLGFQFRVGE
jgi:hypothetical protein